jgi:Ni/Fe-hydrogenase subunit HybB-like protein
LEKLAKAAPFVLGLYLIVRFTQLTMAGDLKYLLSSGLMSLLFWTEIMLGSVFPLVLFSFKRIRQSPNGLLVGAILLLAGMILNRFDVSWFAVKHYDSITYLPSFMSNVHDLPTLPEISVSVGIFSAGILAFGLAARYLPLFEADEAEDGEPQPRAGQLNPSQAKAGD